MRESIWLKALSNMCWSKDDQNIYVAEQSVEGNVYALIKSYNRKEITLSDIVESSAPPAGGYLWCIFLIGSLWFGGTF